MEYKPKCISSKIRSDMSTHSLPLNKTLAREIMQEKETEHER